MIRLVVYLFMFFLSLTSQSFAQNEVVGKGLICKTLGSDYLAHFFNEANRFETYETKEPHLNPGASNSFPLVDIDTLRPEEDFKFEISHSLFWLSKRYVVNESSIVFTDEQLNPRSRYLTPRYITRMDLTYYLDGKPYARCKVYLDKGSFIEKLKTLSEELYDQYKEAHKKQKEYYEESLNELRKKRKI